MLLDDVRTQLVAAWPTDEASCSGAAVWHGDLVAACLRGMRLWFVPLAGGTVAGDPVAALVGEYGRLRAAAVAPDGSLWVLTNNRDGRGDPGPDDDRILRFADGAADGD